MRAEEEAGQLFPPSLHPPHTQTNPLLPAGSGASEFTRARAEEGCQEAFRAAPSLQIHFLQAPDRTQGSRGANCFQTIMAASCFNFKRALMERKMVLNPGYYKYLRETAQLDSELPRKQFVP